MNRTNPSSALLRSSAIAAAVALLALQAQAAPSAADLQQVKAYGNVSVAQDSAGSWGPWTEFEAPAAGPSQPVGLGRSGGEPYRPLPGTTGSNGGGGTTPPVDPGPPPAPTVIGWGLFFDNKAEPKQQGCVALDCHPIQLNIEANYPSADALLPDTVNAQLVALTNIKPKFSETGSLKLDAESPFYSRASETELVYAVPDPQTENPGNVLEMQAAFVRLSLNAYLAGDNSDEPTSQSVYAVVGVATSAADMAALKGRNANATYTGRDQYGSDNVKLAVNFGNGTITGVHNGGTDGVVQATTSPTGRTVLAGQVGFNWAGTITGPNFQATSFSTGNGSINTAASSLNGSFYGKDAAAAGGVVNVVKTSASYPGGGTFTGNFLTVKDK